MDRDLDGYLDRDELDQGSDPADAASLPGAAVLPATARALVIKNKLPDDPTRNKIKLKSSDPLIVRRCPARKVIRAAAATPLAPSRPAW